MVLGYARTSKAERLLSLKPFQNMSDATVQLILKSLARARGLGASTPGLLLDLLRCKSDGYNGRADRQVFVLVRFGVPRSRSL